MMVELEKTTAAVLLKDAANERIIISGTAAGMKAGDPALKLLRSFGYTTFDYTRGKSLINPTPQMQPASETPILNDFLLGNLANTDNQDAACEDLAMMYA